MKAWRPRRSHPNQRKLRRTLGMEMLRPRLTLDGSGLGVSDPLPWFDPGALTYSFAPDGTSVAGEPNRLFSLLDGMGETAQWKSQIDAAFNAWLAPLGVSTHEVADSGSRFGIAGRTQGDFRFGDIRIAAVPLTSQVLAISVPHSAMVQGTWAGDILFNSDANWSSFQDLYSVALHEFGHVLGLSHSSDPLSPMYVHGVHDVLAPRDLDLQLVRDLYAGIRFEDTHAEDGDHGGAGDSLNPASSNPQVDSSSYPFNVNDAVALSASIGTSLRYWASGGVADGATQVYRLEPTAGEPEGLENMMIALQSIDGSHLDAKIAVYDRLGTRVESQILHHGQGNVILQAMGVESDQVHYVTIEAAPDAITSSQDGNFEIIMDLVPELRKSREISQILLSNERPVAEQTFETASSRLVHLHVDSESSKQISEGQKPAVVFVYLIDDADQVVTQIAVPLGQARSAPLSFLPAGQYRLRLASSSDGEGVVESQLSVYLDELSFEVGVGVTDPTGDPYLPCDVPGADPSYCYDYLPIDPVPPVYPDPPSDPIDPIYPWWFDYAYTCSDYPPTDLGNPNVDPLWLEFYTQACPAAPVNPGPVNPGPVNPVPVNPVPVNPNSPWQNPVEPTDVSGDHFVTIRDALLVINLLTSTPGGSITVSDQPLSWYADVNGDFRVTVRDALIVINTIASRRTVFAGLPESPAVGLSGLQDPLRDQVIAQLF